MGFLSKPRSSGSTIQAKSFAEQNGTTLLSAPVASNAQTISENNQYRPIFLLVWRSAKFKAHWAIFVPDSSDKTFKMGRYIHVLGSVQDGFQFQIIRGWHMDRSKVRPDYPIELGWVRSEMLLDPSGFSTKLVKENVARDQLERLLASIPPPAKSLKSAASDSSSRRPGFREKLELSDCQWWVTQCVHMLFDNSHLIPAQKGLNKGRDPREILSSAPRH